MAAHQANRPLAPRIGWADRNLESIDSSFAASPMIMGIGRRKACKPPILTPPYRHPYSIERPIRLDIRVAIDIWICVYSLIHIQGAFHDHSS